MEFPKFTPQRLPKTERRNYNEFIFAAIAATLPVIGIAFTLIFIVYHYRLNPFQVPIAELQTITSNHEPGFYYVNFSATRLTTVASWASTVALVLPGSIMSLYWHRLALFMQDNVRKGNSMAMPTPYEYSLLLALRTGGLPPLWEWVKHYLLRRRQRGNALLSDAGKTLTLALFLGYAFHYHIPEWYN